MILTKAQLGGPWNWGLVRDICEDILGEAGEPQQWVLGGNDSVIRITGPAVEGNEGYLEEGIQVHVMAGPASWAEHFKDEAASTLNDGRALRIAIAETNLDEFNVIRTRLGLALRTMAQYRAAVRNKL